MNDTEILLKKLEPYIDNKCNIIKQRKKEKLKTIYYIFLTIVLVTLPSILNLFNINLFYYIVSVILLGTLKLFRKLPDILSDNKGACYE